MLFVIFIYLVILYSSNCCAGSNLIFEMFCTCKPSKIMCSPSFSDLEYRFCFTGLGYLLECRHRIRGDLLRWEGLGAQSVPQVTPFRFIFHWKTVALYIKKISCPFPSEPLFFHVWVVEEYEEPMQYHLKSSCSSSEVKVQIQACTQWSGGKRLSAQVKVHYWYNILRP